MHLCSPADEQTFTPPERGLLHIWHSAGRNEQLCPERVLLSRPVLQISLGEHHGLLLAQGECVYSFGELLWRDLSIPVSAPVLEASLLGKTVVRVAAGGFHCGALGEQGNVYMWGENTAGQCGQTERVPEPFPVSVVDSEVVPPVVVRVVDLACGREHSLALSAQNELWAWGSGCQLGLVTSTFPVWRPQKVEHLTGRHVIQVACGAYHSLALVRSLPPQDSNTQNPPKKTERGQSPHYSLTEKEELFTTDDAHYCPLGVDSLIFDLLSYSNSGPSGPYSSSPVCLEEVRLCLEKEKQSLQGQKSSSLTNIHQKGKSAASRRRSLPGTPTHGSPRRRRPCACRPSSGRTQAAAPEEADDGLPSLETEVWSWGRGSEGQLGHGDQLARLQPLCIKSLTGEEVIKVAAGSHHSLALTAQCQVYSWGSNMCGQLGHVNSPVTVPQQAKLSDGLRVWSLSAGQSHSLLLADGDCVQPVLLYCGQQQDFAKEFKQGWKFSPHSYLDLDYTYVCLTLLHLTLIVTLTTLCGFFCVCVGGQTCAVLTDHNIMGFISAIHELASRERQFYSWLSDIRKVLLTPLRNRGGRISTIKYYFVHLSTLIGRHATSLSYFLHDVQGRDLTVEYQSLHQGCSQFESLSSSLLRRKKEAETTFVFWKTHSGKTTEVLRLPRRRVVCESSNRSLTLQSAGRFSNHWFILFNDALVHTQFSSHHVYPLTCLWVKPNKWLRSLNQAVDLVLGGGGQGSSPGLTAMSRTASYTFTGDERFKDAQYTGSWLAGRVHGRGTMKWPDGQIYTGNFKNGLEDGYGECMIPNKVLNKPDTYQGQWREGKIHGFGKYKYASGEVYEGCFCDGQRHGYGMLSSGKLAKTSSSVFIGHWVHDRKTGYGVYDDITRGEKYMGLWQDDQRHGSSVVVTQYGVYYEGTFKENKMSGPGLLVSEDDTVFHGEFSDDWTVNGKGVLSLSNGDCLDGMFSGEWSSGLKVVGMYTKPGIYETESKERNSVKLGQYVVPAAQRWICVFDECWSRLGCEAAGKGDRTTAWENIAVTITTVRRQSPDLSRSHSKVLESLEFIPQYGEPVTTANYDNIRRYLTKACETPHHPLGWLVETLVTAYRMTYVGVGSNRRLLRQAVLEVQAYLTHFYSIVRFLFPELPEDGGMIPEPPSSPTRRRHSSNKAEQGVVVVSCSSLLLPLLLPRLYPPLFTLYCLQEEPEEAQYWERILRLNKQPDQSLLSFLGVQEKFWPLWMSILGEKKQIVSSSKDACFVSSVETLQQISTTFTPSDKLVVIQKTFEELTVEVKPMLDGNFLWCMDDLFPLFLYVVLRARIRNLGAEVSLIEDLMDPNIQHGEMGLMFTTLKKLLVQLECFCCGNLSFSYFFTVLDYTAQTTGHSKNSSTSDILQK
uniref:VPS9 domain-containing protein n=1 Tax=Amphiprion ocellaris TaxID=80972 RepID=A0A3Q1B8H8_AMPOC